ncbi:dipeptidyl-peptidase-3 [Dyadobacter jejuensis]|uniref:Dipeptidyl-peptidase-3 n=1 Tax=Dyadobacter jejuensis TaxID=1082580 RepID=A0A316AA38_9BACT|nr:dihydrofolate reductase [Dyadobacter jejuensis]PWJ54533.1 dipeptidyl-peptidase-3 [Dyadobacter jejuensis]
MKALKTSGLLLLAGLLLAGCSDKKENKGPDFEVNAESFADLQVLRYQVPGFEELSLQQKTLAYYLYEAALAGRDIIYDQRGKHNLTIRKTVDAIFDSFKGSKTDEDWKHFQTYAGRVWFSNGIFHHYSNDKFVPECSFAYFSELVKNSNPKQLPLEEGETIEAFLKRIQPLIFDPQYQSKMVDLAEGKDNIARSANNFYEGVSQQEVEQFYAQYPSSGEQPEWGLNSKLTKENGKLIEKVWKSGAMYGPAIDKIIYWLEKAVTVAENEQQKTALTLLVEYYKTGDLKKWDEYNIAWVADTSSRIDVVNGFVEVYNDALGIKGSYESVVSLKDLEATKRIKAIADQAQWFEDHTPLMPEHKKKNVKGISAKAITVIIEGGDAAPNTPIGINLPNSDWVRKEHGSKSVSLSNIIHAYNESSKGNGFLDEFVVDKATGDRLAQYGSLASDLHTDMHECIGHASGQINPGIGTPDKTLKSYASCLEEARADLVGLYFIMDPKLVELGVMPSLEVGKAEYDSYMMNGLFTQLTRLKLGDNIEEAHMRNRALNAYWVYEKGKDQKIVEFVTKEGKTYVKVNDYEKLRGLFGELLKEIQRIKSEGDYEAGKKLVENYGVKVDQPLHKEVLERYAKLNIKPYKGFIQPRLVPILEEGEIVDVKLEYPHSFYNQMIEYGKKYGTLPMYN